MAEYWADEVRELMKDQKWLIALGHAAAATGWVKLLNVWGAPKPFVLSAWQGGGPTPGSDTANVHLLNLEPPENFMDGIKAFERALESTSRRRSSDSGLGPQRQCARARPILRTGH